MPDALVDGHSVQREFEFKHSATAVATVAVKQLEESKTALTDIRRPINAAKIRQFETATNVNIVGGPSESICTACRIQMGITCGHKRVCRADCTVNYKAGTTLALVAAACEAGWIRA